MGYYVVLNVKYSYYQIYYQYNWIPFLIQIYLDIMVLNIIHLNSISLFIVRYSSYHIINFLHYHIMKGCIPQYFVVYLS